MKTVYKNRQIDIKVDVVPGDIKDDAQHIALSIGGRKSNSRDGIELFSTKLKNGTMIKGVLRGDVSITNDEGREVKDSKTYLQYLEDGRAGIQKLNINKAAYIEIVVDKKGEAKKREKPMDVAYSIADSISLINDIEGEK